MAIEDQWTAVVGVTLDGSRPSELDEARRGTDRAVAALRSVAEADPAVSSRQTWGYVDLRLDQLVVTRRGVDQRQNQVANNIEFLGTMVTEISRFGEDLSSASSTVKQYRILQTSHTLAEVADAEAATFANLSVSLRAGFFPAVVPTGPDQPLLLSTVEQMACGYDPKGSGPSCPLYAATASQWATRNTVLNDLQGSELTSELRTRIRTDSTTIGSTVDQALALGDGHNDLSSIDAAAFTRDTIRQIQLRTDTERALLDSL